jgi:hypothetical protein
LYFEDCVAVLNDFFTEPERVQISEPFQRQIIPASQEPVPE